MSLPEGMIRQMPPEPRKSTGKKPKLLDDDKVKILLSTPSEWYVIATTDKWISGSKANIESMSQQNISHLANKGKFEIKQRKNNDGLVDIYCRFVPKKEGK